jgi:hypothetical protein
MTNNSASTTTRIAITNGTVLDTITMTYTENQTVVIENGIMVDVGSDAELPRTRFLRQRRSSFGSPPETVRRRHLGVA